MFQSLQQSGIYKVYLKLSNYLPIAFFFGGFAWDTFTIGKQVQETDLIILSAYLLAAALILVWLARLSHQQALIEDYKTQDLATGQAQTQSDSVEHAWRERAPYFLLQFIFGSLLSALFIVYFKSASHWVALFWSLGLAALLVGNEFLEEHYAWLPLSWSMFGLCAILLSNFLLPCLLGSVHAIWFYVSTAIGVALTHWLYSKTHANAGKIFPVWFIAGFLVLAYSLDWIPPVPLVKQQVVFGTHLEKTPMGYQLQVDQHAWWQFWQLWQWKSPVMHVVRGEPIYCLSAVFAPSGLHTKLFHEWQYFDTKKGWVSTPRLGFELNGGRQGGFRGYTSKQNWQTGRWRVMVETDEGRTLSVDYVELRLSSDIESPVRKLVTIR